MTQLPENEWCQHALVDILKANLEETRRARRWGFFFKVASSVFFIIMSGLFLFSIGMHLYTVSRSHIALVRISGPISPQHDANADRIVQGLSRAFATDHAQYILLNINSPGGSPVQAEIVHDEILRLKQSHPNKKVIAAIEDMGASAAYYIATAADEIYANRASVVGSIGVRMDSFGFTKLMDKLGIERRLYTSGKHKGMLDMFSEPEPEAEKRLQSTLDNIHRQFIEVVKSGRGDKLANNPLLYSGLFWDGKEALKLGLIDGIENHHQITRRLIGEDRTVDYTPAPDIMRKLERGATAMAEMLSQLQTNNLQFEWR